MSPKTEAHRTVNQLCFLVYTSTPAGMPAAEANRIFITFIGDRKLPLVIFRDHFIGNAGGLAIFYVENPQGRDTSLDGDHLPGWDVKIHPLIFSNSPAAFDEQIAFTLKAYRDQNWRSYRKKIGRITGIRGKKLIQLRRICENRDLLKETAISLPSQD